MRILEKSEAVQLGLVNRLYEEVLAASFRPEELGEPWKEGDVPSGLLLVAWDDASDAILGCAIGETYPQSQTLLLGYLAVALEARDRGIGTALMDAVQKRWCHHDTFALAEVDDPRHHDAHKGYGDPWARLRFYTRFDFRALVAPYFQPSLDGHSRAYHLLLCRFLGSPGASAERTVSGERVRTFLAEYFTACEGATALEDSQVRWLLDSYGDEVELVALSDLDRVPDPDPPPK